MEKIWIRDTDETNRSSSHKTQPPQYLTPDELFQLTGVKYVQVLEDVCESEEKLMALRKQAGYDYYDWCEIIADDSAEYKKNQDEYYTEHLHEDAEVRLFLDGSGYFEVRDIHERWVRIYVGRGDLINLPPGIYHRFTLDDEGHIKMLRFFSEVQCRIAVYRCDASGHPARTKYEEFMKQCQMMEVK